VRARAAVVSDEAGLRVAEQTNRLLLRLSAVSMVFLPLTFLTGLVGANLDGIPFAEEGWSFPIFAVACIALGAAMVWGLHRLRLL
jgi:zinc transporter